MNARLVSAQAVHPEGEVQRPSEQDQESAAVFATEALSIQKYNELARVFGPTEVRLLTADTIIGTPLTRCVARRARRKPGSEASASRSPPAAGQPNMRRQRRRGRGRAGAREIFPFRFGALANVPASTSSRKWNCRTPWFEPGSASSWLAALGPQIRRSDVRSQDCT